MEGQLIFALVLTIPLVLLPVAYIWYLNIAGFYAAVQEARKRRTAHEENMRAVAAVK